MTDTMKTALNTLEAICNDKRAHITRNEHYIPQIVQENHAKLKAPAVGFCAAIMRKREQKQPALIAEVKKASPSKGIIRADFDPIKIAMTYERAGATCVSVLTDQPYFKGSDEDLEAVKSSANIPVIRKDFMLTPYQVYESRALGADCILLIVAALDDTNLAQLYALSSDLGMDTLFEVHDEAELNRTLALNPAPKMIGVNSRNLKTLDVDLAVAFDLISKIPATVLRVAESGITTHAQLSSLFDAGYDAFLVGESLMREDDIGEAVRKLLGKYVESV